MPESENRAPQSVYDREAEFPHDDTRSGRRRRPVADWGGDELFTRMPRRRSGHVLGQRRFARFDAEAAEAPPGLGLEPEDIWAASPAGPREPEDNSANPHGEPREPQDVWGEDRPEKGEPGGDRAHAPGPSGAARTRPSAAADVLGRYDDPSGLGQAPPPPAGERMPGDVPGRRTVVIGRSGRSAHPHPGAPFAAVSRRRPPPTVAERIGGRPERIVAWAFALGLILILIAIATAHA